MLLSRPNLVRPSGDSPPRDVVSFLFSGFRSTRHLKTRYGADSGQLEFKKLVIEPPVDSKYFNTKDLLIPDDWRVVKSTMKNDWVVKTNQFGSVVEIVSLMSAVPGYPSVCHMLEASSGAFSVDPDGGTLFFITSDPAEKIHMGYRAIPVEKQEWVSGGEIYAKFDSGAIYYSGPLYITVPMVLHIMLSSPWDMCFNVDSGGFLDKLVGVVCGTREIIPFLIRRPLKIIFQKSPFKIKFTNVPLAIPFETTPLIDVSGADPGYGLKNLPMGLLVTPIDVNATGMLYATHDWEFMWTSEGYLELGNPADTSASIYDFSGNIKLNDRSILYICKEIPIAGVPSTKDSHGDFLSVGIDGKLLAPVVMQTSLGCAIRSLDSYTLTKLFSALKILGSNHTVIMWIECSKYELETIASTVISVGHPAKIICFYTSDEPLDSVTVWGRAELLPKPKWKLVTEQQTIRSVPKNQIPKLVEISQVETSSVMSEDNSVEIADGKLKRMISVGFEVHNGRLWLPWKTQVGRNPIEEESDIEFIQTPSGRNQLEVSRLISSRVKDIEKDLMRLKHGDISKNPDRKLLSLPPSQTVVINFSRSEKPTVYSRKFGGHGDFTHDVHFEEMVLLGEMLGGTLGDDDPYDLAAAAMKAVYFDIHKLVPETLILDFFLTEPHQLEWAALMATTVELKWISNGVMCAAVRQPYGYVGTVAQEHQLLATVKYSFFKHLESSLGLSRCIQLFGGSVELKEKFQVEGMRAYRVISSTGFTEMTSPSGLRFKFAGDMIQLIIIPGCPLIRTPEGFLRLKNHNVVLTAGNPKPPKEYTRVKTIDTIPSMLTLPETVAANLDRYIPRGFYVEPVELNTDQNNVYVVTKKRIKYDQPEVNILNVSQGLEGARFTVTPNTILEFEQCVKPNLSFTIRFKILPKYTDWYFKHIVYDDTKNLAVRGFLSVRYFKYSHYLPDRNPTPKNQRGVIFIIIKDNTKSHLVPYGKTGLYKNGEFFDNPNAHNKFEGILYTGSHTTIYGVIMAGLQRTDFLNVYLMDAPGLESTVMDMILTMAPLFGTLVKRVHLYGITDSIDPTSNPLGLQLVHLTEEPEIKRIRLLGSSNSKPLTNLIKSSNLKWITGEDSKEHFDVTLEITKSDTDPPETLGVLSSNVDTIEQPLGTMVENFNVFLNELKLSSYKDPIGDEYFMWFEKLVEFNSNIESVLVKLDSQNEIFYNIDLDGFNALITGDPQPELSTGISREVPNPRPTSEQVTGYLNSISLQQTLVLENVIEADPGDAELVQNTYTFVDGLNDRNFIYDNIDAVPTVMRFTNNKYLGMRIIMDKTLLNIIPEIDPPGNPVALRCPESYEGVVRLLWFMEGLGGEEPVFKPETQEQEDILIGGLRLWHQTFPRERIRVTFPHVNIMGYSAKVNFQRFIEGLTRPMNTGGLFQKKIIFKINKISKPKKKSLTGNLEYAVDFFQLKRRLLFIDSPYWSNTFKYVDRDNVGSNRWIGRATFLFEDEDFSNMIRSQNQFHTLLEWRSRAN